MLVRRRSALYIGEKLEKATVPRSARHANLETRTGRARLRMRRAPYFVKIAKGLRLGYYRGATAGTWIGRRYLGNGSYETDPLGLADDTTEAEMPAHQISGVWCRRRY
jgi:hypothetical protein